MGIEKILFYLFAALLLASATAVITVRNPVRAALFLVLTFFASAAIWLLLEAEFLAITLVLVYVGAVMVLFLFVVMMLDINLARLREGFIRSDCVVDGRGAGDGGRAGAVWAGKVCRTGATWR
jgi:NADH-quinone oxidoreductase subunit J